MTEPAQNYIPNSLQRSYRTQAIRVWMITASVVLVWVGAIVVAPLLVPSGASTSIYSFFSYICHQIPIARSISPDIRWPFAHDASVFTLAC
jgi:hypothetical protein